MKKRELMVFAGQSNMMGAAVYPPRDPARSQHSFEYKHRDRRRFGRGTFVPAAHPAGEFSYVDLSLAYGEEYLSPDGKSRLTNYWDNTYFCPAMASLCSEEEKTLHRFIEFSEETMQGGASLPPLLAREWEARGGCCAYAHIAKGGMSIRHFLTAEMGGTYQSRINAYNALHGTSLSCDPRLHDQQAGAAEYFLEKCRDFLAEAEEHFADEDTSEKIFVWLQGESDADCTAVEYETYLSVLWDSLKEIGFTKFFMLRIDIWGDPRIRAVMDAQERFCRRNDDAYMMTRALSFIPYTEPTGLLSTVTDEYRLCRDNAYGFDNPHLNEKAFALAAARVADNMVRVLREGREPLLEAERVTGLHYMED